MKHPFVPTFFRLSGVFAALLLAFVLIGPSIVPAQEVEDVSQQAELSRRRRVLLLQERLRLLYSQGQYEEVIDEATALLQIDPGDTTAFLLKDLAEQRIASGDIEPPSQPGNPSSLPPGVTLEDTGYEDILSDIQANEPPPTPVDTTTGPATGLTSDASAGSEGSGPQMGSITEILYGKGGKKRVKPFNLVLFLSTMAGLIAVVTLAGGGIVWLRSKDLAPVETTATAASVGRAMAVGDLPTAEQSLKTDYGDMPTHGDMPTNQDMPTGVEQPTQPGQFDDDEKQADADAPSYAMHDMVTRPDQVSAAYQGQEEVEEQQPEPSSIAFDVGEEPEPSEPALNTEQMEALSSETMDSPIQVESAAAEEEDKEGVGSMGIDYSGTDDALFSQSQALDVEATQSAPFDEAPEERVGADQTDDADSVQLNMEEFAPASSGESKPADDDADFGVDIAAGAVADPVTSISLGDDAYEGGPAEEASEEEESDVLDIAPPAGAPGSGGEEKSYTSLMFGSDSDEEQPASGEAASEDDKTAIEELTAGSFNEQFSDVMFGTGADETRVPEEQKQEVDESVAETIAADSGGISQEETRILASPQEQQPTEVETERETVKLDDQPAGSKKPSMFERQREAGRQALDGGDYAKAVQCLSVAASLKPGDKDVRSMLEEARQKRRGG